MAKDSIKRRNTEQEAPKAPRPTPAPLLDLIEALARQAARDSLAAPKAEEKPNDEQ